MTNAPTMRGARGGARPGQGHEKRTTERPIDKVLSRLDGVLEQRDGWRAFSPFQERRRTRTLAIKQCEDGTVLIHDFGGADTRDILDALGLELSDLFPPRPSATSHQRRPWRPKISPRDALDVLSVEAHVVLMFGRDLIGPDPIRMEDYRRTVEAVKRIEKLRGATL